MLKALVIITGIFTASLNGYTQTEGKWRGVFTIQDTVEVPFNFEIKNNGEVILINADEKFQSGVIRTTGDSLFIPLDQFDNELAFRLENNSMEGVLRKQDGTENLASVKAEKGITYRFAGKGIKPSHDISGKYDVVFSTEKGKEEAAVGVFRQKGNKLEATFLKPSGDARFLEGIIEGNNFYLSSFIGSTPGFFTGTILKTGELTGEQIATRSRKKITGKANENARLPDAYSLTSLKKGLSTFDFSLPGIDGKKVSLRNEKYSNKVVILAITGTWCPNCIDEAGFLSPWYKKNRYRGVEVIALHYERKSDAEFVRKVMTRFRQRFGIEYDQLFGGIATGDSVLKSLPALENFTSFPTTIFIDKDGNVAKIHTGYSGPATGKYYTEFVKEFNEEVNRLLKQ